MQTFATGQMVSVSSTKQQHQTCLGAEPKSQAIPLRTLFVQELYVAVITCSCFASTRHHGSPCILLPNTEAREDKPLCVSSMTLVERLPFRVAPHPTRDASLLYLEASQLMQMSLSKAC